MKTEDTRGVSGLDRMEQTCTRSLYARREGEDESTADELFSDPESAVEQGSVFRS